MAVRLRLTRDDQALVREALAYVSRRMFDQRLAQTAGALEDELDRLLTAPAPPPPGAVLTLESEPLRVLRLVLAAYVEELSRPVSDPANRARVARMRALDRQLAAASGWRGWLRRLLPARG
jgi:hypothetical protein